jgi:mercuric ion transport protein
VAIAAGSLGALGAASCCIVPLLLFTLGVSGAWIGNLTALAAYQPIFLGVGIAFLAAGFWRVYRRPRAACAEGECGTPTSNRLAKTALWLATVLIGLAILFPFLAPLFLDV